MLSSVTLNCQVTKIVMNSGSQLSEFNQCLDNGEIWSNVVGLQIELSIDLDAGRVVHNCNEIIAQDRMLNAGIVMISCHWQRWWCWWRWWQRWRWCWWRQKQCGWVAMSAQLVKPNFLCKCTLGLRARKVVALVRTQMSANWPPPPPPNHPAAKATYCFLEPWINGKLSFWLERQNWRL